MLLSRAAPSSVDALDQWGVQFPLVSQDLAELVRPTPSSLARAISSWRLSLPTLPPRHGDTLGQWGIQFPIAYDELTAFGSNCQGGPGRARISVTLGDRLHLGYRLVPYAAILMLLVAGSASAIPSTASAAGLPTRTDPAPVLAADPSPTTDLASIAEQPLAGSDPRPGSTPGATLRAEAVSIASASAIPAPAGTENPFQARSVRLPTIQDARNYLVARLGTRVDRLYGLSQSQCASLIFEYEARWDPHATNKSSGAYGLPQVNPPRKLAEWADAKAQAAAMAGDLEGALLYRAWRDNAVVQAEWGVDYMTNRYGSPCAALAFRNGAGWY